MMFSLSVAAFAPLAHSADQKIGDRKIVTISIAINAIRAEVQQSWRKSKSWPRTDISFAKERKWLIRNEEIVRGLTRRLDRNPAIDAYIKWQLLGFNAELKNVDPETLRRIVATTPQLLPQPKPQIKKKPKGPAVSMNFGTRINYVRDLDPVVGNGAALYRPRVGSVSSGSSQTVSREDYNRQLIQAVKVANEKLVEARKTVAAINKAIQTYRQDLIKYLPAEGGIRLGMMLKDVRDHAAAGDPNTRIVMQRAIDASKTLGKDKSINPRQRATLAHWTRQLPNIRTSVVQSLEVDKNYKVLPVYHVIRVRKSESEKLLTNLQKGA